jgi:hypothetical protein
MSLRQKLLERSKVAGCDYQQSQLRNFPEISATEAATTAQLPAAKSHEISVLSATGTATVPQPTSCAGGQNHPSKVASVAPSCAPVATVAAPPDDLWPRLEAAAKRCGDYWGDGPERRAEMLESLRSMPERCQQGWIEHPTGPASAAQLIPWTCAVTSTGHRNRAASARFKT